MPMASALPASPTAQPSLPAAQSVADCFEIAYYCVRQSQVRPTMGKGRCQECIGVSARGVGGWVGGRGRGPGAGWRLRCQAAGCAGVGRTVLKHTCMWFCAGCCGVHRSVLRDQGQSINQSINTPTPHTHPARPCPQPPFPTRRSTPASSPSLRCTLPCGWAATTPPARRSATRCPSALTRSWGEREGEGRGGWGLYGALGGGG